MGLNLHAIRCTFKRKSKLNGVHNLINKSLDKSETKQIFGHVLQGKRYKINEITWFVGVIDDAFFGAKMLTDLDQEMELGLNLQDALFQIYILPEKVKKLLKSLKKKKSALLKKTKTQEQTSSVNT
jgi:hypothetical protein